MRRSKSFPGLPTKRRNDIYRRCLNCGAINFKLKKYCRKCGKLIHKKEIEEK